MDLIEWIVGIVDMEMIVEDVVVDMMDKTDVVEGKIVEQVGLHKHILTKFVKVGFGFTEEAKPGMKQEYSMNFYIENFVEFVEDTIEMFLKNVVANLFFMPYNKILEFLLFQFLATLLMLDNSM